MARSRSSGRWLSEHFSDEYVKLAQAQGYRSRAVFKLQELDERDRLLRPGMAVVDLGAAPGGWSQYAAQRVGHCGKVIALDILPMEALPNVTFIQGDFREDLILDSLRASLTGQAIDLVLSDMAPNMSGNRVVDQARSMHLAELALDTALEILGARGSFVAKLFHGPDVDAYVKTVRSAFGRVSVRKPKASRDRSSEVYLVAQDRK